jgi:tetratricopeptide (TPR) repeat protein
LNADVALSRGQAETARTAYERALNHDPNHLGLWLRLGNSHAIAGDAWKALAAFETAYRLAVRQVEENPKRPPDERARIADTLSRLWQRLGDPERALEWNGRSIETAESSGLRAELRSARVELLSSLDRTSEAEQQLLRLLAEPVRLDTARLLRRLGDLRLNLGNRQAALTAFSAALDAGDTDPSLLAFIGRSELDDDPELAVAHLSRSLALVPNEAVHRLLVVAQAKKGDQEAAKRELARYRATYPEARAAALETLVARSR